MSLIATNTSLLVLQANGSLQLTRCTSLMDRSSWQPTSTAADSPQCSARQDSKRYNHVTLMTHQQTHRCFADARLKLWNNPPVHLRQTDINFEQFQRLLKTFLFGS